MTTQRPWTFAEQRLSRRGALRAGGIGVAASLGSGAVNRALAQEATPTAMTTSDDDLAQDGLAVDIMATFKTLPGTKGLNFWAPPDAGRPAWSAMFDADRQMVIASAFKGFVLAEYLRQAEATADPAASTPPAAQFAAQLREELVLDE